MHRFALLIACLAVAAANTCLADEPASCKSMCVSEQQQCSGAQPKDARLMRAGPPAKNQLASGNPGGLRGYDPRQHDEGADAFRRAARGSACEATARQCALDCDKQQQTAGAAKETQ